MKPWFLACVLSSACMSSGFEKSLEDAHHLAQKHGVGANSRLTLARNNKDNKDIQKILSQPLTQEGAVALALMGSPQLQGALAQGWVQAALIAQQGSLKPLSLQLTLENQGGGHWEWGRYLSLNLWDLLTYPKRYAGAKHLLQANTYQMAIATLNLVSTTQEAWVAAVAAQEKGAYTKKILDLAHVSTTIAQRMRKLGHFHKLDEHRHSTFLSYAKVQHAASTAQVTHAFETLVSLLGLDDEEKKTLQLPPHLPPLPKTIEPKEAYIARAAQDRLDMALAQAQAEALGDSPFLESLAQNTAAQARVGWQSPTGGGNMVAPKDLSQELAVAVPLSPSLFSTEPQRAQQWAGAQRLVATQKEALSQTRRAYARYAQAHAIAQEFQDSILPLSSSQSEENLLRYNAMIIGVFDLLTDTQEHLARVLQSIDALADFWLAHVGLNRAIVGTATSRGPALPNSGGSPALPQSKGDAH